MKKHLCMLLFFMSLVHGQLLANYLSKDKEEEYVEITAETMTSDRERSLSFIECIISRKYDSITLSYAGIGTPFVSIYDFSGVQICSQVGFSDSGSVVLPLPVSEGVYQIVIRSSRYRGAGVFCIY